MDDTLTLGQEMLADGITQHASPTRLGKWLSMRVARAVVKALDAEEDSPAQMWHYARFAPWSRIMKWYDADYHDRLMIAAEKLARVMRS